MAGTRFTLDTSALKPLEARVRAMADMDTSTLMPRLGEYLQRSVQDRFKAQAAPDGTPWETLAPRTAKRKKYNANKVLTERGFLRRGIHYQVTAPGTVEVGSNLVYAATHQFGRGNIPARPFLGLSTHDEQEIFAIVSDWAAPRGFAA